LLVLVARVHYLLTMALQLNNVQLVARLAAVR
jgi:hypothetical protein